MVIMTTLWKTKQIWWPLGIFNYWLLQFAEKKIIKIICNRWFSSLQLFWLVLNITVGFTANSNKIENPFWHLFLLRKAINFIRGRFLSPRIGGRLNEGYKKCEERNKTQFCRLTLFKYHRKSYFAVYYFIIPGCCSNVKITFLGNFHYQWVSDQ